MPNFNKPPRIGNAPNCHHHWWMLIWLVYFAFFMLDEHIVTDVYWVSYLPLDDQIPFAEWFVVFYVLWYPMLIAMTLYSAFWDVAAFRRFMLFIGVGFLSVSALYLIWPNGQDLRPAVFPRDNVFTRLIAMLYAADTNTNVCPSLHVIGCFAVIFGVFDCKKLRKSWLRPAVILLSVLVVSSTVFIKQHSILDIFVAIPYSLIVYVLVYHVFLPMKNDKNLNL